MAEPYLTNLRLLVAVGLGTDDAGITCKHFFSGAAVYLDDKIIASISPVGLAFKLDDESCRRELGGSAVPLRYFPKSPIKRNYVLFEDVDSLPGERVAALLRRSIDHARSGDH